MGIFSELGLDTDNEQLQESQTVAVGGGIIQPGVYLMQVDRSYLTKSSGGAVQACVDFIYKNESGEDSKFFYNTYISSGDEKGNKTTYTDKKTGSEKLLPGVIEFNHFLQSIGQPDPESKVATIELFNEPTEVKALPTLTGKQCYIGIRHKYDDYKEKDIAFVDGFLDKDGKNSKGEDLLETLKDKIDKAPTKKTKAKAKTATAPSNQDNAVATQGGW